MASRKDKISHYDKVVDKTNKFERKGKTMPYTSANGYMFSFFNKDDEFGIRFPKERCSALMEELDTTVFKSHGAVMRDYVLIPDTVFLNESLLLSFLEESYTYVMTLKPK